MSARRTGTGRASRGALRAAGAALALLALSAIGHAQSASREGAERFASDVDIFTGGGGSVSALVHVPVVTLYPGAVPVRPTVKSPVADDPAAAQRGMEYFIQMNCVGCHAPNGAGGMGPALSNAKFVYGGEPENIYLSILQGRPNGMPAWGGMLPDQMIWDLVAYIQSISKEPRGAWGKTTSADGFTVEQVPSEFITTTTPWDYTTPFSYGQAPFEKPKGSPPLESPK
jgi:cytochrome c oxidase cbb3-type subunit 3